MVERRDIWEGERVLDWSGVGKKVESRLIITNIVAEYKSRIFGKSMHSVGCRTARGRKGSLELFVPCEEVMVRRSLLFLAPIMGSAWVATRWRIG